MTLLSDIGEDELIAKLVALVPHARGMSGPGDDCAVIDTGAHSDTLQLLKTDALIERVHFLTNAPARAVGWKAIARVVSDFAAMGGTPEHFLVTLALPKSTPLEWIEMVYHGMGDCLLRFGGLLAGGETSCAPDGSPAMISIAATGRVSREHLVLRSSARQDDIIFVTGSLGGSISGKHLNFMPRMTEAAWLVRHFKPSAMMDLSDGLGKDLPRLAASSGCGFIMEESALPITSGCTLSQAIGDGEDFELLFTLSPGQANELTRAWKETFPDLVLTPIGHMTARGKGITLAGGWEHFKSLGYL